MSEHWIIVGAGSAGCVLANRLSADSNRHVTLLDDGPDLAEGHVPAGISGSSFFAAMAEPGRLHPDLIATRSPGIEPTLYQRGRGIGGSSAVNAMVALAGDDAQYEGWGWADAGAARGNVQIPTQVADEHELGPVDRALLAADSRATALPLTRRAGARVTSAEAYLWPIRSRSNLSVRPLSPVANIVFSGTRARGVQLDDGSTIAADRVLLCAGAIHSPVLLLRSGVQTAGIGHGLQEHPSAVFTLQLRHHVDQDQTGLPIASGLHASIDEHAIQLLAMSHLGPAPETAGLGALMAALMNPVGRSGSVGIDANGAPVVDFALLSDRRDLHGLMAAAGLAKAVLDRPAFHDIVEAVFIDDRGTTIESLTNQRAMQEWLTSACGDYVHATSTCAMGTVVDHDFAVHGYHNLLVCDASVFPSIPVVNTHLPTTMLAERFALRHA